MNVDLFRSAVSSIKHKGQEVASNAKNLLQDVSMQASQENFKTMYKKGKAGVLSSIGKIEPTKDATLERRISGAAATKKVLTEMENEFAGLVTSIADMARRYEKLCELLQKFRGSCDSLIVRSDMEHDIVGEEDEETEEEEVVVGQDGQKQIVKKKRKRKVSSFRSRTAVSNTGRSGGGGGSSSSPAGAATTPSTTTATVATDTSDSEVSDFDVVECLHPAESSPPAKGSHLPRDGLGSHFVRAGSTDKHHHHHHHHEYYDPQAIDVLHSEHIEEFRMKMKNAVAELHDTIENSCTPIAKSSFASLEKETTAVSSEVKVAQCDYDLLRADVAALDHQVDKMKQNLANISRSPVSSDPKVQQMATQQLEVAGGELAMERERLHIVGKKYKTTSKEGRRRMHYALEQASMSTWSCYNIFFAQMSNFFEESTVMGRSMATALVTLKNSQNVAKLISTEKREMLKKLREAQDEEVAQRRQKNMESFAEWTSSSGSPNNNPTAINTSSSSTTPGNNNSSRSETGSQPVGTSQPQTLQRVVTISPESNNATTMVKISSAELLGGDSVHLFTANTSPSVVPVASAPSPDTLRPASSSSPQQQQQHQVTTSPQHQSQQQQTASGDEDFESFFTQRMDAKFGTQHNNNSAGGGI